MSDDTEDTNDDAAEQALTDSINDLRESHKTLNELFGAMDNLQHIDRDTAAARDQVRELITRELHTLRKSIDDVESGLQ